jgi:hypothetical protein
MLFVVPIFALSIAGCGNISGDEALATDEKTAVTEDQGAFSDAIPEEVLAQLGEGDDIAKVYRADEMEAAESANKDFIINMCHLGAANNTYTYNPVAGVALGMSSQPTSAYDRVGCYNTWVADVTNTLNNGSLVLSGGWGEAMPGSSTECLKARAYLRTYGYTGSTVTYLGNTSCVGQWVIDACEFSCNNNNFDWGPEYETVMRQFWVEPEVQDFDKVRIAVQAYKDLGGGWSYAVQAKMITWLAFYE